MKAILVLVLAALPTVSFAKDVKISVQTMTYQSPASVLLSGLQMELAREAIKACGSLESIVSVNDISITIVGSDVSRGVLAGVSMGEFGPGLDLNYPEMKATATATCN
jgi:hypothetical protein